MDIATIVGLVAGILLVIVTVLMGGDPSIFLNLPAVILVVGGTLAATLINYPLADVLSVWNSVRYAFTHKVSPPEELIERLVQYAAIARREGVLALEAHAREADDPFLRRAIELAIDGCTPELIKEILTTDVDFMEDRHAMGQSILNTMGMFAPAFGMIGTLLGLVQMLVALENPAQIGHGMAVALLTTLYGALLAYLILLPCAGKLKVRTEAELVRREMVIEGIIAIQSGDNPRIVEKKLQSFVAPAQRRHVHLDR